MLIVILSRSPLTVNDPDADYLEVEEVAVSVAQPPPGKAPAKGRYRNFWLPLESIAMV